MSTWLSTSLIALTGQRTRANQETRIRGDLYVGVDFGKHQDHSVVAVLDAREDQIYLRHMKQFPLETPYGAVIGYIKQLQDSWRTVRAIYADKTGVGEYIFEDMNKAGLRNVTDINFTEQSKEAMATCLKEKMRTAICPDCDYRGFVDTEEDTWQTTCPMECTDPYSSPIGLRPLLHIPYQPDLFAELNVERYELSKTGKILFNPTEGTHDDRFWALATYAVEMEPPTASIPIGRIIS